MTTATLTRTEPTSDRHVDPGGVARHLAAM